MAKSLQSLPFQIADREARIADLEADLAAVTAQRDAAVEALKAVLDDIDVALAYAHKHHVEQFKAAIAQAQQVIAKAEG